MNFLRLFTARASEDFDIEIFNRGDYIRAVEQKIASENISRVLYPSDSVLSGKELRLTQEYFLVACALRDILRQYASTHIGFDELPAKVAVQMNDTHPSLCVAELMRLLVDEHMVDWDRAWELTVATLGYTNHTLLPEAPGKMAGLADGTHPATAHGDHLRHQPSVSPHRGAHLAGRHEPRSAACPSLKKARRSMCAWRTLPLSAATP